MEGTLIHAAADIEGHRGTDGKFYLLSVITHHTIVHDHGHHQHSHHSTFSLTTVHVDCARTFPPEPPSKSMLSILIPCSDADLKEAPQQFDITRREFMSNLTTYLDLDGNGGGVVITGLGELNMVFLAS